MKKVISMIKKFGLLLIFTVFGIVAALLHIIANLFHLTYNEVNILFYYLILPLYWCILISPLLSTIFILFWIYIFITKRKFFKEWCDVVFDISVIFLLKFQKIGWSYQTASVIICVLIPILITIILLI